MRKNKIIFCIIVCCFCIFACKAKEPKEPKEPKEEIKKIGSIDKPLNLSLLFHKSGGIRISEDTIDGNVIETLLYPYSINIADDSIIVTTRLKRDERYYKEYRGELTDEQHLRIKKLVSALNQKYEIGERGPLGGWTCILEIDNQVHYEHRACEAPPGFSHPYFSPMPKEIHSLFLYIVDLSPIRIMGYKNASDE